MKTLAEVLSSAGGAAPGADALRLGLASAVVVSHALPLSYGPQAEPTLGGIIVPMFFALSGMLVTASALRTTVLQFAINRALRIFPALTAATLLAALVVGPLVTTLNLGEYFSSYAFWRYLGGSVALVTFELPGVFEGLPFPKAVNGSLWSIPVELQCYAILAFLMVTGVIARRSIMMVVLVLTLSLGAIVPLTAGSTGLHFKTAQFLSLFGYFAAGSVLYLYRHVVPLRASLFLGAAVVSLVALLTRHHAIVLPLTTAYCTVYLAVLPLRCPFGRDDYSYGVYVYAFPIQQLVAMILPLHWALNLAVSLPASLALAAISWRLIEKPALSLKRRAPDKAGCATTAPLPVSG